MYARIAVIGDTRLGEAGFSCRIAEALKRAGHAVTLCSANAPNAPLVIEASQRGFRPSIVFVEQRMLLSNKPIYQAVQKLGLPTVQFGDGVHVEMSDAAESSTLAGTYRDDAYIQACCSLPDGTRPHAVIVPHGLDDRVEGLLRRLEREASLSVERYAPLRGAAPLDLNLGVAAAIGRSAKLCLLFDGQWRMSAQDVAMRISEGCVVLVERSLADTWDGSLGDAVVLFDEGDLVETVSGLLASTSRYKACLQRQRVWLDALPLLDDALEDMFANDSLCKAAATLEHPSRDVVVYGWLGMQNFGDDLLLQVVADHVESRFPEAVVRVIGGDSERIKTEFGFDAVRANEHYRMFNMVRRASCVVFCGGLIFDDPFAFTPGDIELFVEPYMDPACQAGVCLMAWRFGVPALYLGAGLGPIAKPAARAALRYIGLAGARLLLRDQDSVKLALDCGYPSEQVAAYADLVLSARDTVLNRASDNLPSGLEPGRYFTVVLRDWPLNPPGFERALAAELDRIASQTGLTIAFVPFDPDDVHIHHRVADAMQTAQVVEVKTRLSMPDMLAVVKHSAMAVAMRLHCSILHHVLGKPAIGLDYNEKVGSHFREMERGDYLVSLDEVADRLSGAALRAWNDPEATKAEIEEGLDALRPKVEAAFQELFCAIEAHEPAPEEPEVYYPRARSQAAVDLEASRAHEQELASRVEALEGELSAARARIADLEQSTSYRLGHALVKVPHALFKRT
ncbi:polysaccharide pyruvyl transferase family protein [Collinsella sp. An2]|uniref:polysaccharide pyruvyl transferase family protein n=1 Tax=Collinsella sp. An2 TaxID=1965585 RepID=UPI000B385C61|nr:polysaccharide pyruvyl transferase family protein [Collinsella sp. An2]OUP10510.1 hypothetical protein B5F33_02790 [Collinsella sp. An2]